MQDLVLPPQKLDIQDPDQNTEQDKAEPIILEDETSITHTRDLHGSNNQIPLHQVLYITNFFKKNKDSFANIL